MEKSNLQILTNGIIKENPVLVLVLGTCPTMAVTTMAKNGIGMGLAATFVLLGSNIVISLLKKIIPDKVRIPCYIVVIAGFVTLLSALLQAYATDIYNALGIFSAADCSKLYHPGSCRDVCKQKQRAQIGTGRHRYGHWIYLSSADYRLHP